MLLIVGLLAITVHSIRSIKAVFLQIHKYKLTSALLPEGFASTFKNSAGVPLPNCG
jgi:hypothetical protein